MKEPAGAGKEVPAAQGAPLFDGPLTLEDAIEFAIRYNLDAAVMRLERDIREEAHAGAKLKMLPSLELGGELGRRDTFSASFSSPLDEETGSGFQDYNYSRDKTTKRMNLELSWDLLDFGIAYLQQKQTFDQIDIAEQRRRRMVQNLQLDVTEAFWKVQVMKAAMQMAGELVDRLKAREKILQEQYEARIVSEIDVLETAAALTEMKLKMSSFEEEHQKYKLQLASLIGLTGLVDFRVVTMDFQTPIEEIDIDLPRLEKMALKQRPELIEQVIEERITSEDARIAVTKMAPSTSLFWKYNYDGDSHLYYDKWHEVGLRVSLNLLSIPQQRSQQKEARKKQELIRKRRLSLAAAIMTQLNIAVVNYGDVTRKYTQTKEIEATRRQLMEARRRHSKLGKGRIEDVLKSEARHLFSQVSTLSSYADVMIAEARIFNTIGQNKKQGR